MRYITCSFSFLATAEVSFEELQSTYLVYVMGTVKWVCKIITNVTIKGSAFS